MELDLCTELVGRLLVLSLESRSNTAGFSEDDVVIEMLINGPFMYVIHIWQLSVESVGVIYVLIHPIPRHLLNLERQR